MTPRRRVLATLTLAALLIAAMGGVHAQSQATAQTPPTIVALPGLGTGGASATLLPGSTNDAGEFTFTTGSMVPPGGDGLVALHFSTIHQVIAVVSPADIQTVTQERTSGAAWVTPGVGQVALGLVSVGFSETYTFTYLAHAQ